MAKLRTHVVCSCVVLLAWLGLHGCGDDSAKPTPGKRRDAGGQMDTDASVDGSSGEDKDGSMAGGDGGPGGRDAGPGSDDDGGPAADGGKPGSEPEACELSDDANSFAVDVPFSNDASYSVTKGSTGFGVAFHGMGCDGLEVMPVHSAGAFASPTKLLDDCVSVRDVSLLHVPTGWRLVWVDNSASSGAELQSMLVSENMSGSVGELRTRITDNAMLEQRPMLATVDGKPFLAFIAGDDAQGTRRISTLVMDDKSALKDLLPDTKARKPNNLTLAQVGKDRVAVVWVEEQGMPGIWLQTTDLTGAAQGDPVQITELGSAGTAIDLATRDIGDGGALLYSVAIGGVNNEVRMRRIGPMGELVSDERKVVGAPLQGRDASFARLGGGYVVAYRALPGGPITSSEVRITFISKEGNQQHDAQGQLLTYKIADASAGGGRVTVRVSNDGQLLVGFVDQAAGGGRVLRLVRKRLDCAL